MFLTDLLDTITLTLESLQIPYMLSGSLAPHSIQFTHE
jgi:hypothetical protein